MENIIYLQLSNVADTQITQPSGIKRNTYGLCFSHYNNQTNIADFVGHTLGGNGYSLKSISIRDLISKDGNPYTKVDVTLSLNETIVNTAFVLRQENEVLVNQLYYLVYKASYDFLETKTSKKPTTGEVESFMSNPSEDLETVKKSINNLTIKTYGYQRKNKENGTWAVKQDGKPDIVQGISLEMNGEKAFPYYLNYKNDYIYKGEPYQLYSPVLYSPKIKGEPTEDVTKALVSKEGYKIKDPYWVASDKEIKDKINQTLSKVFPYVRSNTNNSIDINSIGKDQTILPPQTVTKETTAINEDTGEIVTTVAEVPMSEITAEMPF